VRVLELAELVRVHQVVQVEFRLRQAALAELAAIVRQMQLALQARLRVVWPLAE